MNERLQITFLHTATSPAVEFRIRREAAKLDRYFGRILSCRVVIEAPHKMRLHDDGYHLRIEIGVPGKDLIVKHDAARHCVATPAENGEWTNRMVPQPGCEDIYAAIRDAFATARRKLEDYARRLRGEVKCHAAGNDVLELSA